MKMSYTETYRVQVLHYDAKGKYAGRVDEVRPVDQSGSYILKEVRSNVPMWDVHWDKELHGFHREY